MNGKNGNIRFPVSLLLLLCGQIVSASTILVTSDFSSVNQSQLSAFQQITLTNADTTSPVEIPIWIL